MFVSAGLINCVVDIRAQFGEQLKCLEQRTEVQVALLAEIQDFYRRRAEIESEYSKSLEKLTKQTFSRHKAEKQKWVPEYAFSKKEKEKANIPT